MSQFKRHLCSSKLPQKPQVQRGLQFSFLYVLVSAFGARIYVKVGWRVVLWAKNESKGSKGSGNNDKNPLVSECGNEIPLGFF